MATKRVLVIGSKKKPQVVSSAEELSKWLAERVQHVEMVWLEDKPSKPSGADLAVVLGGDSIAGGAGNLLGVILGVFIMGVLSNGLIILNVTEYNQMVVRGLVLIIAVGIDQIRIRARGN